MKKFSIKTCQLILLLILAITGTLSCQVQDNQPFTVILLPDTQNYSEKYPDTYLAQTSWVAENIEEENTRFVIHLGDMVQNSEVEEEWEIAHRAHLVFDEAEPRYPTAWSPAIMMWCTGVKSRRGRLIFTRNISVRSVSREGNGTGEEWMG